MVTTLFKSVSMSAQTPEKAIIINYLHNAAHKLIIDIIRAKLTNEEVTTLQQLISKITK